MAVMDSVMAVMNNVSQSRRAIIQLNLAVALFGLAGLLGKATSASPIMLVAGRTAFGSIAFGLLLTTGQMKWPGGPPRRIGKLALPGLLLAFHWISFFESIRVSNVAIALLTYSSCPVFVTIFEPLLFSRRRRSIDAVTAGLVLAGVLILVPAFDLTNSTTAGICWGLVSGLSFAALMLLNRKLTDQFSAAIVTAGQCAFAALALILLLPAYYQPLELRDWGVLLILGVVFTALAHFLFIQSLTRVPAQLASIVSSMESVYGVLFAWMFLGEIPSSRTWLGGMLILAAVILAAGAESPESS